MLDRMKGKGQKILFILVMILLVLPVYSRVFAANTLSKYEQELESVMQEQQENASKLTGIERELALYAYDIAQIDVEIVKFSKQMAGIQIGMDETQETIDVLEEALLTANENYSVLNSTYVKRLRSIYENGIPSIFDLMVSSNNFSEFMIKLNLYSIILDHDKLLMNSYQDKQNYINYIKADIELEKTKLESLKAEVEESAKGLEEKRQAKVDRKAEIEDEQGRLVAMATMLTNKRKGAMQDVENEMAKIINEVADQIRNGTSLTFTGTDFVYPTPNFITITTRFAEIYNLVDPAGSAHTGVDIAGYQINGTPIYAMQAGTVVTSGYSNYGYGNYIIINHGACADDNASYISLYGHCSSLVVNEGEIVEKGQLIGFVGTTGNSTGPHLHLEVRVNGNRVDPLMFFPGISFIYV